MMFEELRNKTVLVTGATGLLGQVIVNRLIELRAIVVAVIRNAEKAKKAFGDNDRIKYIVSDITQIDIRKMEIDYIIHAASITSSKLFVNSPVDVALTAIEGTRRTLEIAKLSGIKGYVYLSSMEVYGNPQTDDKILEDCPSNLDCMKVRSAYPESKRICENLCVSFFSQYKVPTHTYILVQCQVTK